MPVPTSLNRRFAATDSQGRCVRPGRMLITPAQIRTRVRQLAADVAATYDHDSDFMIVAIMTGALVFLADLIRAMPRPMRMGLILMTNYGGTATTARGPRLLCDVQADVADKDLLVVDDILDTGQTLAAVLDRLRSRSPRSIRTCVLLRKQLPSPPVIEPDFVGFDVPDEFVIGYGLDYDDLFRNFPGIAVLDRDVKDRRHD